MSADFIDSNVFVYLFDESAPTKRDTAKELVRVGMENGATISYQVVQETLNVITRKLPTPLTAQDADEFLRAVLMPLWRVMPTERLFRRSLEIQDRYRLGFYDSLIVAAALEAGCSRLYSEDLQHGQRIESLTISNPFKPTP